MKKQVTALVMALVLALGVLPMGALAAEAPSAESQEMAAVYQLMDNIAKGYQDRSDEWVVMDMAAYAALRQNGIATTDKALQSYVNKAITGLTQEGVGETTYAKAVTILHSVGADPAVLYPVNSNESFSAVEGLKGSTHSSSAWSAPYTVFAYQQGEYGTQEQEKETVQAFLAGQREDGSWDEYGTIEPTANILTALAFYVEEDAAVKAAADKAVSYLSSAQGENGGYGDANKDAMVILALAAMGIDPDTDGRFVKNGVSLLDSLLSYALEDQSGLGYMDNSSRNELATEQGFRALVAAAEVMTTGEAYNVYDFSEVAVEPARATSTGESEGPGDPTGTDTFSVTVTVQADTEYWLEEKTVTVKEGSTVYHAFVSALEGTGITQVGAEEGYVSQMSKDGKTLAEFTNGPESGWLYKVNGQRPAVGITTYSVHSGDQIIFYYTNDWTTEPGVEMPFTDLEGHWAKDEVQKAWKMGLMDGVSKTTFAPDQAFDRAMTVTVLYRMAGSPAVQGTHPFVDVAKDQWYSDAVLWAWEQGITKGDAGDQFAPSRAVTREELATMLYRYVQSKGMGFEDGWSYELNAPDRGEISDWAYEAVCWMNKEGILKGNPDDTIAPKGTATRGETAALYVRLAEKLDA
ncbi:MAG: S-layer homology domain-containing protein [Evtepia sp.]|uniref:S-layer homology domain-containing protein n=1 Tax=Evtepia sp. TaxID=2773933 RepID=UPI002A74A626|nr:S-layer homology domain-containing protein [Evtepia sp.]MDY3014123.1 S-layer homology domain-containing protein [Evtepia sp.]